MDNPVEKLRILMLEDVPSDAELEEMELRDAGLAYSLQRVDTRAAFEQALDEFKPDIVLADYKLPAYNGRDALEYVHRTHPQIPVIMVTGVLGDEAAVELLKLGARDYVLKDHLPRLVPAIQRVLSEERNIRNRNLAEKKLRESEEKFRKISDSARDAISMTGPDEKNSFWNKAAGDKPGEKLRILMLEDLPTDAELVEMELRDAKLVYSLQRVDTCEAFVEALYEFKPDIVLADFKLPAYNGRDALLYVRSTFPQIPVIMVTGILGDEAAVELLKLGARDYVLKDHLPRLVPAIQRALSDERDIRNRNLAEKKLRENEEKFRRISDSARNAIGMMSPDEKNSFWNKADEDKPGEKLRILMLEDLPTDAELEEIELRDAGLVYTLRRVETRAAFVQALDEFKPDIVLADYKLPDYNGRDALLYVRSTYPQIPVIMVTGTLGDESAVELLKLGAHDYVLKDHLPRLVPVIQRALSEERGIRSRKLAEKKLRESEEKFRKMSDSAQDAIIMMDPEGKISFWNKAAENIFGYTSEEALGQEMLGLLALPSTYAAYKRWLEQFFASSKVHVPGRVLELVALRKGGIKFPVELSVSAVQLGGKWNSIGIVRDITERKRAEQIIQDEKEFSDSLIRSLPDIFYLVDHQGRLLRWSRKGEELLGLPPEKLLMANVLTFIHEEDRSLILQKIKQAFETGSAEAEARMLMKAGVRNYILSARRIETQSGVNLVGIGIDITERKRAEDSMHRANRALQTLSSCNLALVRAASEDELLRKVTGIVVEKGGYSMAMVGYAGDDPEKSIVPVAWSGTEESTCWAQHLSWDDTEFGQTPVAKAIRSGTMQICRDIVSDPGFSPWRDVVLARGYKANIALPLSDDNKTFGGLSIFSSETNVFDEQEVQLLEEMANDLAFGIVTLRTAVERDKVAAENQQYMVKIKDNLENTIQAIAATVEMRDPYTAGHEKRVAELAVAIGRELGLPEDRLEGLHIAGSVHDLGKVRVPAEILSKPGTLDEVEYSMIKIHPEMGYQILKGIDFPWPVANIVRQHHERLDGSGYPGGLKGNEILFEAQILAVADAIDAMMSHRPYRPALGPDDALKKIMDDRGKLFNADVVDACIKLFKENRFVFP